MQHDHDHDHETGGQEGSAIWLDRVNEAYYDQLSERMGMRTRERINWMCAQCEGGTVLDVGCSQGITSILLGREGFRALGIDIMAQAVDYANRELALEPDEVQARVAFQRMDLLSMPVGEGYDNVVLGEVVEHQTSAERFLRAARRHVAPEGRMIVTVPFGLHPFPDHKCTVFPRHVVAAMEGFDIERLEVVGGYIRVVAVNRAGSQRFDGDRLVEVTEQGTEEAQAAHFEAAGAARKVDAKRRELAEKLKALTESNRKQVRDAEAVHSRTREELTQLKSQLLVLRGESLAASGESERLRSQLAAIEKQSAKSREAMDALKQEIESLRKLGAEKSDLVEQVQTKIRRLGLDLGKAARETAAQQRRYDRKVEQMTDYRRRLEHQHDTVKSWLNDANQELAFIKESVSFRLGLTLMSGLRSPRDFVALPVRIGRLVSSGLRRRSARRLVKQSGSDPQEVDPGLAWSDPAAIAKARKREPAGADAAGQPRRDQQEASDDATSLIEPSDVRPVNLPSERVPMLPLPDHETIPATPAIAFPQRVADLRVAAIMDDFTRESFRHCCELRQVTPGAWQQELAGFRPHLLLVESAWKGENEQWARKIYPLSTELAQMLAWARESGIPTAFWNKEDPVHFSVFLPTARLFDHVFTTDIDCIKGYRAELGHDRVHLLPFACEPRSHNPIEAYPRAPGFSFAGSYYAKYPERQRDFSAIVDALRKISTVDIYDRNHGKDEPSLQFPETYVPLIRGSLPYDQIDRAYKGYRYGININTVKQSQSMFARRAFDLLASNTVTVSNFSRGMRLMFGDLVVSSDDGREVERRIGPLLADERGYRKFRLQGLRKVMAEHTYEDRLAFVVRKLSGKPVASSLPSVRVLAKVADGDDVRAIIAAYRRQAYPAKALTMMAVAGFQPGESVGGDIQVCTEQEAAARHADEVSEGFVAVFDARDYYGANYLTDLALATRYSPAQVIGKRSHFKAGPWGDVSLESDGSQYTSVEALPLRAAIVRADALGRATVADTVADPDALAGTGLTALATDEFNYCRGLADDHCEQADDIVLADTGIELARLQEIAESTPERHARTGVDAHVFTGFGPHELAQLFPGGEYADGRVQLEPGDDGIAISSRLGEGKFTYVYADAPIPVETLFPDEIGRFNMLVSSDMLLSFTLIFLDGAFKRIGHVIRACNSNQGLVPLEGTRYVMLGFRIQGAGLATLRRLVLQHVPPDVDAIAGAGKQLLVARGYPAYDDLYSYTFVHRRVQGYRRSGAAVDVFRLDNSPLSYEEFEGVDVVSGNVGDLALMLDSNHYESILVHSFDEQVWSAVESRLSETRVIVWVHGAEIQPWYRRDFNNAGEAERKRSIQRSDMRLGLWRRVLEEMPDNLHLVFVSEFLARQAMQDLGIEIPRDKYSVIHNVVDGDFFTYHPKSPPQRHRVLSIRPYSKRTYANDLAVKAILDLSREPWFGELSFSLFGDGPLFEETVAPLRDGFANVRIERRFLGRGEIRDLHREHGVFLVPSRIDSQGVSRDEAMASGLVPVTNRVSAIPEFVDDDVAMLAPAEDWGALADGIRALHADPDRFLAMSARAATHVRRISGPESTLLREIQLIHSPAAHSTGASIPVPARRIAVYGDLNLNLIDGSAVWAASLVEVMAGLPDVLVDLFMKTRLSNPRVLAGVLELPNVRLVEPTQYGDVPAYQPEEAVARIADAHSRNPYDAIVLRGYRLCLAAAREPRLRGRLWTYLTDIPQSQHLLDADWSAGLAEIADAARYMLCQTGGIEALIEASIPAARGKTRRLPPMVPGAAPGIDDAGRRAEDGVLRIVYAGKFAPLWGIREMFATVVGLNARGIKCELHVFGDKIHNPPEDPGFRDEVLTRLQQTPGVVWHGGVARDALLAALPAMDIGWAWRHAELEAATLELSTKVLEYGLCGLPSIMRGGPANTEAFGGDYPLFADDADALVGILARAAVQPDLLDEAARRSREVAGRHTFAAIREHWVAALLPTRGCGTVEASGGA